jgi:hypothetical protein
VAFADQPAELLDEPRHARRVGHITFDEQIVPLAH